MIRVCTHLLDATRIGQRRTTPKRFIAASVQSVITAGPIFSDLQEARRNWWLIVEPGADVDLCSVDRGMA
jgi:hypothetical protein